MSCSFAHQHSWGRKQTIADMFASEVMKHLMSVCSKWGWDAWTQGPSLCPVNCFNTEGSTLVGRVTTSLQEPIWATVPGTFLSSNRTPSVFCLHWGLNQEPSACQPSAQQAELSPPQPPMVVWSYLKEEKILAASFMINRFLFQTFILVPDLLVLMFCALSTDLKTTRWNEIQAARRDWTSKFTPDKFHSGSYSWICYTGMPDSTLWLEPAFLWCSMFEMCIKTHRTDIFCPKTSEGSKDFYMLYTHLFAL